MSSSAIPETVRQPAVAGQFYPSQPDKLREMVDGFMNRAPVQAWGRPKAVIAPHAGYIYSGPIAASSFAHFVTDKATIKRIILLGPSHRYWFEGIALTRADALATPFGAVPVDKEAVNQIRKLPQVQFEERAHTNEHSLEVELPFLQQTLGEFTIVPLVVGEAGAEAIAEVIEQVWGGDETRLVISSDLSHYHDYETARTLDRRTADAIENFEPQQIKGDRACGHIPIRGLLHAAQARKLSAKAVDLRNSGDTAGSRGQVVGYGAFVFNQN
ncbi:MAG: AmmeMemoRadiSam system protein B [Verrucomicrobia bacterium]|nr:MAG: AmmeMemoRadiSam system protein B [Verrucomicrobiota bacterium]